MANYMTMLEGKQAEEYLKKKQEAKNKKEQEDREKVESRQSRKFGSTGWQKRDANDRYNTREYTADRNPKYKAAKEIEQHRRKYNDVMPSTTKSEKELQEKRDQESKITEKARAAAGAVTKKKYPYPNTNNSSVVKQVNRYHFTAQDAAERKYRRDAKKSAKKPVKESADISINVKII